MTDLSSRLRINHNLEYGEEPIAPFFSVRVAEGTLREIRTGSWPTSERSLDALGTPQARSRGDDAESVLVERDGWLVLASLRQGYVHVQLAAPDEETADAALKTVRELLPSPEPSERHDVPVAFWTYTPNGPMPSLRPITVPEWDEIHVNYAASTRTHLDRVMRDFRPAHGGQLILWHGPAGTGKTYALRALAWEWRDWCQLHYIVDPDTFFGERADYLMGVLTQPSGLTMGVHSMAGGWSSYGAQAIFHDHEFTLDDMDGDDEDIDGSDSKRWRLLVLEDTGELLTPDAKSIIGQGLSRFLNVVDGLIGQGLRILVLVTTNEEIRTLHPAVSRPGRCAANIHFTPLPRDEATAWLTERGVSEEPRESSTLASLYAQVEGFDPNEPRPSVGFAE